MPADKKIRRASPKKAKTGGAVKRKKAAKQMTSREVRRELVRVLYIVHRGFLRGLLKDQTMLTTVHTARGSRIKRESLSSIVRSALLAAGLTIPTKWHAKAGT